MEKPDTCPVTVIYYDGATTFGGALRVLSTLFDHINKSEFRPLLVSAAPRTDLTGQFAESDIALSSAPNLTYVQRARWMARVARLPAALRRLASYLYSFAAVLANLPNTVAIIRVLLRERPGLIHVNNNPTPLLAAAVLRIPVVWHIHEIPQTPGLVDRMLMKSVARFIAISDYVAQAAIAAGYPANRITVIPNPAPNLGNIGCRQTDLHEQFDIPINHFVIAHVGRILRWKGQLEFLAALARVVDKHPGVTALIVGDNAEGFNRGYFPELTRYVRDHGLSQNVRFTGRLDNILEVMTAADLVVHSSIEPEPFGLVITEAMAAGTPVVASRLGAPSEIITDYVDGLLVDPEDSDAFSKTLLEVIENEPLRSKLSATAKSTVEARYTPTSYAENIAALYRTTANRKPSRTR